MIKCCFGKYYVLFMEGFLKFQSEFKMDFELRDCGIWELTQREAPAPSQADINQQHTQDLPQRPWL